jgi:uncharacterized membrane protein YedE/YeeE
MKNNLVAFVVGLIFAIGLGISGMTRPEKVVGFLDVFGDWDPSLVFVMGGAVVIHFFTYRMITKRSSPMFAKEWKIPTKSELTPRLIMGSFLFGVGWGLGGYCPGPGLVSIPSLDTAPLTFVGFMLLGMLLFKKLKIRGS